MHSSVLLCTFSTLFLALLFPNVRSAGTTPYIQQVFIGKCFEENPIGLNCSLMWEEFSSAAMQSNTEVNLTAYDGFFSMSDFSTPVNQTLFWSGNKMFAQTLSGPGNAYSTVEETATGFILNNLQWCGMLNSTTPEFDYNNPCIYPMNATYFGSQGVWLECSHRFAKAATGFITVLLQPQPVNYYNPNGPYQAFRNDSIFATTEIPSIVASQITYVRILLIKNTTVSDEVCGNGSMKVLVDTLQTKFKAANMPDITIECIDDLDNIFKILCPSGNEQSAECLAALISAKGQIIDKKDKEAEIGYLIWAIVMTVASIVLGILLFISKKRYTDDSQYIRIS